MLFVASPTTQRERRSGQTTGQASLANYEVTSSTGSIRSFATRETWWRTTLAGSGETDPDLLGLSRVTVGAPSRSA